METKITSNNNENIKEWKKLHSKKNRKSSKFFLVEGIKIIEDALDWGITLEAFIYNDKLLSIKEGNELYNKVKKKNIPIFQLSSRIFKELSNTMNSQGVIGLVQQLRYKTEDIFINQYETLIILDAIQDPGNLGTIIRTADAAGFDGVIMGKGCVDLYNDKVLRSTMGSIFHLPILQDVPLNFLLKDLQRKEYQIIGTHLSSKIFYNRVNYKKKKALIIGNEARGISKEIEVLCTELVKIPIKGYAESLNAAIAAGILMYEMQKSLL